MTVGLPAKKAVHRLVQDYSGYISATMRNDSLYVLHAPSNNEEIAFIREFKLSEFDGEEGCVPYIYTQSGVTLFRPFFCKNDQLYMFGKRPEIFDLTTKQLLYSEYVAQANPEWLCCTKHSSFRLPPSAKDSCFYSDAIFF